MSGRIRKLVVCYNWSYDMIPHKFFKSLFASDVRTDPGMEIVSLPTPSQTVTGNLNVDHALAKGATEILHLDVDQAVPKDVLARMRAHNKDIVSALTPLRMEPYDWSMFKFLPDGQRGATREQPVRRLQRVDAVGCGCMLVQAHVYRSLRPPWFCTECDDLGMRMVRSSDFFFFQKVKEAGYEVWVDTTLESGHDTTFELNSKTLRREIKYEDEPAEAVGVK